MAQQRWETKAGLPTMGLMYKGDWYDLKAFDRLFNMTAIQENGCWNFTGYKDKYGRGAFGYRGSSHVAPRISYLLTKDDIPSGICVLHSCDNPSCINPEHLFLGTQMDNVHDMIIKGRDNFSLRNPMKGSLNGQSILNEDRVKQIKSLLNEGRLLYRELAESFGVSRQTITNIATGRCWSHV